MKTPLIFIHIPKTGGTSLWSALRQAHGARYVRRIEQNDTAANIARLDAMLEDGEAAHLRLLGGHVFFEARRDYPHMTMLREPVKRAVSAYYHALRVPTNRHYERLNAENIDLEEGLRVISPNLHVRYLAAVPLDREPEASDLQRAMTNLEQHFEGIGLLERFHESLILFKRVFGGRMPYYIRRNVGTNKQENTHPAAYTIASEVNALDVELYRFAVELYEKRLTTQGNSLKRSLFLFERTLPLWRQIHSRTAKKQ